ncbi:hypothetical protein Q9L58_005844 [Maublancomyces gigas]|uniref:Uncharacterized protein n=1 Tax=Discina gigas TaxID=1032678 RepID=A0ABR3GH86_9PEZI
MSSQGEGQHAASANGPGPGNRVPPAPPPPRKAFKPPGPSKSRPAIPSKYLINDIPRNTRSDKLFNYLVSPPHYRDEDDVAAAEKAQPHVQFSCIITDSRLDDELSVAVFDADEKMVQVLLHWKADVQIQDNNQKTPLQWAEQNAKLDIVRVLTDQIAEVEARGSPQTALQEAAQEEEIEALDGQTDGIEVEQGTDYPEASLLINAAARAQARTVNTPLAKGAGIEAADKSHQVALHLAAGKGHTETVTGLLAKGANVDAVDDWHRTVLHLAAKNGHKEIVIALLAKGANIEAGDEGRRTALHMAAKNGHKETVTALLAKGANVEAADEWRQTALHIAAGCAQPETVTALLAKGANIEAADKSFQTALRWRPRMDT